jgi:hypothetical protein
LAVAGEAPWGLLGASAIVTKVPDGIADGNKLFVATPPDYEEINLDNTWPSVYGDNSAQLVVGKFTMKGSDDIAIKNTGGNWTIFEGSDKLWGLWDDPATILEPNGIFGDILCRPIPADYDGDEFDDMAVQCGTTWKIVYSSNDSIREVDLGSALDPLPSYSYAGGIKYQDQADLFNYYKTKLLCQSGQKCLASDTIFNVVPPIGPYFAECVKYWAPNASYCWDK